MKKQLQKYINYGISKKAQIEIFAQESKEESIEVCNQKVEKATSATDRGLAVRVIKNNRFGFSYTTSQDEADILKTIDNAIESTKYTNKDTNWTLPKPAKIKPKKNLKLYDSKIEKMTTTKKIAIAKEIESTAYKTDKRIKKTESSSFSTDTSQSWTINSNGVYFSDQHSSCGASIEIIAKSGKKMEAGFDYQYTTHLSDLNYKNIGKKAATKALNMLEAKDIKTGIYEIILPPNMSTNFLSIIAPMFSAKNIQNNKSLLKGKLNKKIASNKITILDDPFVPKGLGSYIHDAEGVLGQKKVMVKNGVLQQYLYDTYTANKGKTKSTGNSGRYSLKGEPGISPSNFYIKPGKSTPKELIKNVTSGVIIQSLMGLHTADPISGQFSLGATGQLVINGKIAHSVKNLAIAGNLIDFLENISHIGSDLEFFPDSGSLGSPTIIIKNIQISGNN